MTLTNVNDEVPVFMKSIDHVQVSEDASPNTVVHVIQAFDPDGDDVTYSFRGESFGWYNVFSVNFTDLCPRALIIDEDAHWAGISC